MANFMNSRSMLNSFVVGVVLLVLVALTDLGFHSSSMIETLDWYTDEEDELKIRRVHWTLGVLHSHGSSSHLPPESLKEQGKKYPQQYRDEAWTAIEELRRLLLSLNHFEVSPDWERYSYCTYVRNYLLPCFRQAQLYFLHGKFKTAHYLALWLQADFRVVILNDHNVVYPT